MPWALVIVLTAAVIWLRRVVVDLARMVGGMDSAAGARGAAALDSWAS
jgi:hypothetical protein